MNKKIEELAVRVEKLSPAAKLLMASQLVEQAPEVAITLAQKAIDQMTLAKLLAK